MEATMSATITAASPTTDSSNRYENETTQQKVSDFELIGSGKDRDVIAIDDSMHSDENSIGSSSLLVIKHRDIAEFFNSQLTGYTGGKNLVPHLSTEAWRTLICSVPADELKDILSTLSADKFKTLISSLAIKWNFTINDIEVLKTECKSAEDKLEKLYKANSTLSAWTVSKSFWLTSDEKLQIGKNLEKGNNLINKAQAIFARLQEIVGESDPEERQKLFLEQLIICCELVQSVEELKKFEESIEIPSFSMPTFIKILESGPLDKVLNAFPGLASGGLGCILLAKVVVLSVLEVALCGFLFTVAAFGSKMLADSAISVYKNRIIQKTEDNKEIKEKIFAELNKFLEEELDMASIPDRVNLHTTSIINQAGLAVGEKLDEISADLLEIQELLAAKNSSASPAAGSSSIPTWAKSKHDTRTELGNKAELLRLALAQEIGGDPAKAKEQIDQILSLLIDKLRSNSSMSYSKAVRELSNESKISGKVKTFLNDRDEGESFWNTSKSLNEIYIEEEIKTPEKIYSALVKYSKGVKKEDTKTTSAVVQKLP
jgi:hypothetical protein